MAWSPCADDAGLQCGTLVVPLDYARPDGPTIPIAVARHPAEDPAARIGSLVIDPGGPGVSGIDDMANELDALTPQLLDDFDIVLFDPRGVERSDPVSCGAAAGSAPSDPAPTTASERTATIEGLHAFAAACEKNSANVLPYVGTVDVARDMDRLRQALGDSGLTYMGQSYGTLLGLTYASLFPTHIRAMVLDSVIDPALSFDQITEGQAAGFEGVLNAFFSWCAASAACRWRPAGDPTTAVLALLADAETAPAPAGGGSTAGRGTALRRVARLALLGGGLAPARRHPGRRRRRQRRAGRGPVEPLQHRRRLQRRRGRHRHRLPRPSRVARPGHVSRSGLCPFDHCSRLRPVAGLGRGGVRGLARAADPEGRTGGRAGLRRPSWSWAPPTTRPRPTPGRSAWPRSSTTGCCSPTTATTTWRTSPARACAPTSRPI